MSTFDIIPIRWGVEAFDYESEEDYGIPIIISSFAEGGREIIESYWKIYAYEEYDDSWDAIAICQYSDDRRYQKGDEVELVIYKDDDVWDIDSILSEALKEAGF